MASAERKRASFTLGRVLIAYLNAWFLTRWPEIPQLKSGNNAFLQDLDQSRLYILTYHLSARAFRPISGIAGMSHDSACV